MPVAFKNWQNFLDSSVKKLISNGTFKGFINCSNDEERVALLLENRLLKRETWIDEYFSAAAKHCDKDKDISKSTQFREEGNNFFCKKKDEKALELYTKCILCAPEGVNDPPALALGYANRSAALYNLGHYQEAAGDVCLALSHGYPANLQWKLYQRHGQCRAQLGLTDAAQTAYENAINALDENISLQDVKKGVLRKNIENLKSQLIDSSDKPITENIQPPPCPTGGCGSTLVDASKHVQIEVADKKGRHLVATKPVKVGDVLIVEKPYASVLLPGHYETHCHHCYTHVLASIPCVQCSTVRYCSILCRDASWKKYHYAECRHLSLLHSVGIAHLSLRVVLVAGLQHLLDFPKYYAGLQRAGRVEGLSETGLYSSNYLAVYDLMSHTADLSPEDLCQYTMTAALLLKCVENSGFFNDLDASHKQAGSIDEKMECLTVKSPESSTVCTTNSATPPDAARHLVGGLLLRHICQLVCNAHAITELQVSQSIDSTLVDNASQDRIATAIYPTTSLMNHSCDPSIISSFDKDTVVIRAVKDVDVGSEIYTCYGPHHRRMGRPQRLRVLREQYFFKCLCPPCTAQTDKDTSKAFKCEQCSGPFFPPKGVCVECGHRHEDISAYAQVLMTTETQLKEGMERTEKGDVAGTVTVLTESYEKRQKILYRHNKYLAHMEDMLARSYASLGKYHECAQFLKRSIDTTEVIYGADSVELANELHKLSEVLVNAGNPATALKTARRAMGIFVQNYGESHKSVREIRKMEKGLVDIVKQIEFGRSLHNKKKVEENRN